MGEDSPLFPPFGKVLGEPLSPLVFSELDGEELGSASQCLVGCSGAQEAPCAGSQRACPLQTLRAW